MSKNNQTFQRNILRYIALLFALLLCKDIRASDTPFANGNLTKDSNKGISSITYNCLNLPGKVTFSNGNSVTFTYAADGTKLKVVYVIGAATVTDYFCDNVIYEGGTQKYLLNEEGYYNLATSTYCYYLRDHQGNNRVVINSSGTVQETNHYYPFGGLFATTSAQPYKYNSKELMAKNGLNWYDYGARHYDPALGRFVTGDPMAEKLYGNSLYSYCVNNPLRWIDKNGMLPGPGDTFPTKREAAVDWGMYYNGSSILRKQEMASVIYEVTKNGMTKYAYTEAVILGRHEGKARIYSPGKVTASIHSHGNYDGQIIENGEIKAVRENEFSTKDLNTNKKSQQVGYLATPNGSLLEHNPVTDMIETISTELPSDSKDPSRLNDVAPKDNQRTIFTKIFDFIKDLIE